MKIVRIFGVVLALHVVVLLVFFQPGCQSKPRPQAAETAPAMGEPVEQLEDWEAADSSADRADRPRSSPRRPTQDASRSSSSPDDSVLTPLPSGVGDVPEPTPDSSRSASRDRQETRTYTVRSGDSLWLIANRNNVSLSALLSANGLTEGSVIQPGQELQLPVSSSRSSGTPSSRTKPVAREGTTTYKVRSGDSLSVIAQRHGTTVADLKALNNLSGDSIRIDQELIVPEREGASSDGARKSTSSSAAPTGDGERHVVVAGETPGGIAAKYGVTVGELMSANDISDPRRMRIGQNLLVPGTGSGEAKKSAEKAPKEAEEEPEPEEEEFAPRDIRVIPTDDPEEEEEDEDGDFPIIPILPEDN